jgi:hypothetical protein
MPVILEHVLDSTAPNRAVTEGMMREEHSAKLFWTKRRQLAGLKA